MSAENLVIRTHALTRHYIMGSGSIQALRGVDLTLAAGEFVALMGVSGSGKTTLLHLLGCLDRPSSGNYWLEGVDIASLDKDALATLRSQRIGFIFQNFNLLPRYKAWENVALPLIYQHISGGAAAQRSRALQALERVGLKERANHMPVELSGGERQRVAIARALVTQPAIILADEPTGNLDSATGAEILNLLVNLHAEGCTILLVTHDYQTARRANRLCLMHDGVLLESEFRDVHN